MEDFNQIYEGISQCRASIDSMKDELDKLDNKTRVAEIAQRIKQYMVKFNISEYRMAQLLGIERSSLSRILNGKTTRIRSLTKTKIMRIIGEE